MEQAKNSEINVRRLAEGDTETFNSFYRIWYQRMFSFANSYCRNDFVAGSIVQDIFTALWENRENLEPEMNLPAYLLTAVRNKSINYLNHIAIGERVKGEVQSLALRELEVRCSLLTACNPENLFHDDMQHIIEETLDSLPYQCRRVVMMSRFDGFSHKEIAWKLDISVKAVEYHITKALKILRRNLKDYLIG